MTKDSQYHFYISDEAYEGLVRRARLTGHIRGATRARGLGDYMVDLIRTNLLPELWQDTRPKYASGGDVQLLEAGKLPIWNRMLQTRNRCTAFSERAQIYTDWLARQLGITRKGPGGLGTVSAFWEAVGLGWLTPKNPPKPPMWKGPTRTQPNEFDW